MVGGIKGNERMWVEVQNVDCDELYISKVAHPVKVMVWGAVSYYVVALLP